MMVEQLSLFTLPRPKPKTIKDKHSKKPPTKQFSNCHCSVCNKFVFMKWVVFGKTKKCEECGTKYELQGILFEVSKNGT